MSVRLAVAIACRTNNGPERRSANVRDRACWDQPQRVEAYPTVAAMTYPDLSHLQVVGGFLTLALVFVCVSSPQGR